MIEGVRVDVGRKNEFGRFVVFEAESFGEEVVTLLVRLGKDMVRRQKFMSGKGLFRDNIDAGGIGVLCQNEFAIVDMKHTLVGGER